MVSVSFNCEVVRGDKQWGHKSFCYDCIKRTKKEGTRQTSSTPKSAKAHGLKLCSVADKPEEMAESLGNDGSEQMGGGGTWDMMNIL